MAIHNLDNPRKNELLASLIKASALVDVAWLRGEGLQLTEPFVPQVFSYAVETAAKYERLRKNKLVAILAKLFRR